MKKLVLIGLAFLITTSLSILYAQKTVVRYAPDDDGTVYTSVEAALKAEKAVYRLKLTKLANRDSLPEELFQLTELRELTVKGCRLCRLNQNIGKLTKLQYLNLDHNKLLRLPESIGSLRQLATIDAWGNPLYVLPNSIGELRKTLRVLDLRQIPLTKWEYEAMEQLLPETDILFTDICECENRRDHD